jgi:holo-[acyl-carrier protein] synthase
MILGIGVDAVEIERVEQMLARLGDRLIERVLCAGEAEYVRRRSSRPEFLAVRLAAKEAAYKALAGSGSTAGMGWRDVEVVKHASGAPALSLHGRAAERFRQMGARVAHVTLTHSLHTAIAVVIVEG